MPSIPPVLSVPERIAVLIVVLAATLCDQELVESFQAVDKILNESDRIAEGFVDVGL